MRWTEKVEGEGVVERRFDLEANGRRVPGVLWTPVGAAGVLPLVLIGHGGSQHKRGEGTLAVARRFVTDHGCAAAAIDGPVHGDRRSDGGLDPARVFQDAMASWAHADTIDDMAADWRAALDALVRLEDLAGGPVGYWGLSMGTLYGVPFLASDARVRAAVLGLWGLAGTAPETWEKLAAYSPSVGCPLLYLAQMEDQLFPPDGVLDLFGKLGSTDKRLHLNVGTHGEVPSEEYEGSNRFLAERLRSR